jgi:hypothetical protein
MNDNQNYSDYFNNLSGMAQQQDKGRLRSLVLNYHSSLQRLPALKQEMDLLLQSNDAIDYDDLIKRIEPVLQQASDWLLKIDLLPSAIATQSSVKETVAKYSSIMRLSTVNLLIQQFESEIQKTEQIISQPKIIGAFTVQHGIATNKLTGLMWLRFSLGQKWQNNTVVGEANKFTWQQAIEIAQQFNQQVSYEGFNDWRLPSIEELKTLINKINGISYNYINVEVFPKNECLYWSSSPYADSSGHALIGDFWNGCDAYDNKNNGHFVRLVRRNW